MGQIASYVLSSFIFTLHHFPRSLMPWEATHVLHSPRSFLFTIWLGPSRGLSSMELPQFQPLFVLSPNSFEAVFIFGEKDVVII